MALCLFQPLPIFSLELSIRSISGITEHHADCPNKLYISTRPEGFEHGHFTIKASFQAVFTRISQMRTPWGDLKDRISVILQGSSRDQRGWKWTVQRVKKA